MLAASSIWYQYVLHYRILCRFKLLWRYHLPINYGILSMLTIVSAALPAIGTAQSAAFLLLTPTRRRLGRPLAFDARSGFQAFA